MYKKLDEFFNPKPKPNPLVSSPSPVKTIVSTQFSC